MENWFDKNKFFEKLLIFTWIIFLFFCLYLLSFTSHAESYFPMHQNNNGIFTEFVKNSIDNYLDSDNNFIFCEYWAIDSDYFTTYYVKWPKNDGMQLFAEINSNGYQFSLYRTNLSNFTIGYLNINIHNGNVSDYSATFDHFYNLYSNSYYPTIDYVSNFRLYTNNTDNRKIVLNYGFADDLVFSGHATEPDPYEEPILAQGSNYTLPREVPEAPTINNYTWVTYAPPSVDNSTLENLLGSLVDIVKYNANYISINISNEFNTLFGVIKDTGDFIAKTIQYYVGLVNDNIINGFTNLYDNIVSLFEPALNALAYIAEPVDGSIIYDNISSTSLVTNISTINNALSTFQSSFNNLSEPNSFTIPIHLENLPTAYFGVQTTQYIDLGVLGSTEKVIIRTFMWALITYSFFITIVDSISNYINGGGDES